jgi:hypothetical protein
MKVILMVPNEGYFDDLMKVNLMVPNEGYFDGT